MGVHDVRVTVLHLPLVSGVQGEGEWAHHLSSFPWAPVLCWSKVSRKKKVQNVQV